MVDLLVRHLETSEGVWQWDLLAFGEDLEILNPLLLYLHRGRGFKHLLNYPRRKKRIGSILKKMEITGGNYGCDSKEVVEIRRWSDLPMDILVLIIGRLYFAEQIRFRAVCKSWQVVNVVPSVKLPWIMSFNNIAEKCQFFDPSPNQTYTIDHSRTFSEEVGKDLSGAMIMASKNGWLLLQNASSIFLFNPFFTRYPENLIKLPVLESIGCFHVRATLSATPTSPHCIVFVIFCNENSEIVMNTCRCGDSEWKSYKSDTISPGSLNNRIKGVVYMDGKVYCMLRDLELRAFCTSGHDWIVVSKSPLQLQSLGITLYQLCNQPRWYGIDMIESDGKLLLITTSYVSNLFRIFSFDWLTMTWVKEHRLGDRTVFFNRSNGSSLAVSTFGDLTDRICYHKIGYIEFYSFASTSHDCSSQFYPEDVEFGIRGLWIEPPQL